MDLADLQLFLTIVDAGGFGAAANHVGLSQSAVSRRIQGLEGVIGFELFDRERRGAHLSAAGRVFEPEARDLVSRGREATRAARATAEGSAGILRIGFVGPTIYSMVPALLGAYHRARPGVEIRLSELTSRVQREELEREHIDVGFQGLGGLPDSLDASSLGTEEVMIALHVDHPLSSWDVVPLARLADAPFVLPDTDFEEGLSRLLQGMCRRAGFTPRVAYRANRAFNLLALVSAGLGVAFAPASLAKASTIRDVVFRPLDPPGPSFEEGVVWHPANSNPCLRTFLEIVASRA